MDTNTVASLLSLIEEQGRWTSNICLPVYESLESDEVVELDFCSTQCRPGEEGRTPRMSVTTTDGVQEFRFRVSSIDSEFHNFGISFFRNYSNYEF